MFSKLFRVCRDDSHSSSSEKLKQPSHLSAWLPYLLGLCRPCEYGGFLLMSSSYVKLRLRKLFWFIHSTLHGCLREMFYDRKSALVEMQQEGTCWNLFEALLLVSATDIIIKTLKILEEKEVVLQKKISQEVDRAKGFTRANNKQAAIECLKRKKYYEGKMDQLGTFQLHIRNQEKKLQQDCHPT
ncbi:uncharacterized protein LOC135635987 [Musa acuminata AAA Group]|uniref:uncharacterized protein LOC135635987 n=1 Tax=Musa acuminata AAA Group TaxID=214697 RepID=UPI0031E234DC